MFCAMAFNTAREGREEDLTLAALDHARALRRQPGCVAAYVLRERDSKAQVSISIFETEEAFRRGADATRPVIAKHHIDRWLESPSVFRVFDVQ
jgi:heme-degrading monooxygenase HmoA